MERVRKNKNKTFVLETNPGASIKKICKIEGLFGKHPLPLATISFQISFQMIENNEQAATTDEIHTKISNFNLHDDTLVNYFKTKTFVEKIDPIFPSCVTSLTVNEEATFLCKFSNSSTIEFNVKLLDFKNKKHWFEVVKQDRVSEAMLQLRLVKKTVNTSVYFWKVLPRLERALSFSEPMFVQLERNLENVRQGQKVIINTEEPISTAWISIEVYLDTMATMFIWYKLSTRQKELLTMFRRFIKEKTIHSFFRNFDIDSHLSSECSCEYCSQGPFVGIKKETLKKLTALSKSHLYKIFVCAAIAFNILGDNDKARALLAEQEKMVWIKLPKNNESDKSWLALATGESEWGLSKLSTN